jgi:tetratricopeptide (TPR) repeat protein
MGALKTGNVDRARHDVDHLRELYASYAGKPDEAYWAGQTQVLFQAGSAWLTLKQADKGEALGLMRAAVDLDESSEKNVAMENRLVPMRELLGYMLLETGQPKQALTEFETSLKAKPNRLRGYYGAAKAAEAAGEGAVARMWYQKLVALTKNADTERAEVVEAKGFLAKTEPRSAATSQ